MNRETSARTLLLALLVFLIAAGSVEFAFYTWVLHLAQLQAQAAVSVLTRQEQRKAHTSAQLQATAESFERLYLQTTRNTPVLSESLKASATEDRDFNNWDEFDLAGKSGCVFTGGVYRISAYESKSSIDTYLNETRCAPGRSGIIILSDFALSVQMKIIRGDEGGIFIDCDSSPSTSPPSSANPLYFGVTHKGFYELKGQFSRFLLRGGRSSAFKRGLQQLNLIAMIVHGNELSLFINEHYVDHINLDNFYNDCTPSLFARSNIQPLQPTVVEFSDLRVWAVPPLFHPAPISSVSTTNDYPMFGFNPQHTHTNSGERAFTPGNVSQLMQIWTATTGKGILSSPIEANGVVYISSSDHELSAFDAKTGKLRWSTPKEDSMHTPLLLSTPAIANGLVYIGTDDNRLKAFDALSGKLRWASASTGVPIVSSPVVADGIVYVGSSDNALYAFDAPTGHFLWEALADCYTICSSLNSTISSSPAVANGIVYVGSRDGKLYAFNAQTGDPLWTADTGGTIYSSPAVANGVVYIGSLRNALYAFDAATGKLRWKYDVGGPVFSSPVVIGNVVFFGSENAELVALDASTGQYLWKFKAGSSINSSPAVAGGYVYVGSSDSKLYAFHLSQK
jgi:outer membrane protein assembly factor BamB